VRSLPATFSQIDALAPTFVVCDQIRQLERVGRFRDVVRKACETRLLPVGRLPVAGHRNQQRWQARHLAQRSRDLISVEAWKTDVTHDHVRPMPERGVKTDYWKTGHSYIKRRTSELKALAGFEKSGHFFFNPPIGNGYDDGIVAGIAVLEMLDRAGDTASDIQLRRNDLAGLADLPVVRSVAFIDGSQTGTKARAQLVRQRP